MIYVSEKAKDRVVQLMEEKQFNSERVSNGKAIDKICFSPMVIAQFYFFDHPWILQPWFTQREPNIEAYDENSYIEPETNPYINRQLA